MHLQDRALYNLLRLNWRDDPSLTIQPWQVEDYRAKPLSEIFKRLRGLGIVLDEKSFKEYASTVETPEELAECLWLKEEDEEDYGHAYLLLFELWRRLFPEQQSLSIFCDELDYQIDLYDHNAVQDEDKMQAIIKELEDILDRHADLGIQPKEVFTMVGQYCAHDLERFLFDYIADQIDCGNDIYASEMLDGFSSYVKNEEGFDFLKGRLLYETEPEEAEMLFQGLLEQMEENCPFDLLLEMSAYFSTLTNPTLFFQTLRLSLKAMRDTKDFFDLLELLVEFYRLNDREESYHTAHKILEHQELRSQDIKTVMQHPEIRKVLEWIAAHEY